MQGSLSTLLVLAAFSGVFYIGHQYQWRMPKFSALTGNGSADVDDWCKEHNVPESICVECNPKLMPKEPDYGFCLLHGLHNCPIEHPDVAQLKETPSPMLLKAASARAMHALGTLPRKENNSRCKLYQSRIQFASLESVEQAGVEVDLVQEGRIVEAIAANGEIIYDPTRKASLASRQPGNVWAIEKNLGDKVTRGEVLAVIDAKAVGEAKTQLLRALAEEKLQQQNVVRLEQARAAISGAKLLEAQAALSKATADVLSAEQMLRNLGIPVRAEELRSLDETAALQALRILGIPPEIGARLDESAATANLLPIVAPIDGVVVRRDASLGEVVDPTRVLFEIADTRNMWLQLSVPLENLDHIAVGQQVQFTADGSRRTIEGQLDWISTTADRHTRMIQARATLANGDGKLRNQTFGTGKIVLRDDPRAVVIPNNATNWEGCCQIVFVRDRHYFEKSSPKVFHVRSVRLGASQNGVTEVIAGLLPGEVIATGGSDVLRAQLLKNGLGAGCCEMN
ncbi:MAG: efflux RND transporter periplasmic adaptor subunit [Aureliella sp.]